MQLPRPLAIIGCAILIVLLFAAWTEANRPIKGPHGQLELALLKSDRNWVVGVFFANADRCAGCHGHDPQGIASIDAQGKDINVVDDWRTTMMANSARDPFFRAKMAHEVLVAPQHRTAIENSCLSCHAPMGMHEERMLGHGPFTAAMLDTSALGLDGVSCLSCHMQSPEEAGSFFSGDLHFDSARVYGPYTTDQINPAIMTDFVGWAPDFGAHMIDSRNCAGCHTLITETMDLSGNYTGDRFVEQATYHEWKNSVYSSSGVQCNSCHMPRTNDPIILAAEYSFLSPQSPFGKHHFVGGNVHMLRLLKDNKEVLGIDATDAQFDSTIARTQRMLQQSTLLMQIDPIDRDADTARFELELVNLAGHRFPSGFPSRRAIVQFVVLDQVNDTLFKSGMLGSDLEVEGIDDGHEPHYDLINDPDQVQIYEMVMGDVTGNETTVLHRAKEPIKDNRLPPVGFTTSHISYDTTRIFGNALLDADFNRDVSGEEGSGSDRIRYHVPINGYDGPLQVIARVLYQPVPPGWNAEMFAHSSAEIDAFATMLASSDATPTVVVADSIILGPLSIEEQLADRISIHPNPTHDGWISIGSDRPIDIVSVHDAGGRTQQTVIEKRNDLWRVQLPGSAGVYLIILRIDDQLVLKRVLRT